MVKRVKGGITKHYCDGCKKLIYDTIPKPTTTTPIKIFGVVVTEVKIKRHADYKSVMASKKRGIEAGEYCIECCEKMQVK